MLKYERQHGKQRKRKRRRNKKKDEQKRKIKPNTDSQKKRGISHKTRHKNTTTRTTKTATKITTTMLTSTTDGVRGHPRERRRDVGSVRPGIGRGGEEREGSGRRTHVVNTSAIINFAY